MKIIRQGLTFFSAGLFLLAVLAPAAHADAWRGAQDANGMTWARITFVNESAEDSTWAVWNCRTAVNSGADWAITDATSDWDGVVPAGTVQHVWVYGYLDGEVFIGNSDGDESTHQGGALLDPNGSAEWVVTVAPDRTVTSVLSPAAYGVPAHEGDLPNPPEVEEGE